MLKYPKILIVDILFAKYTRICFHFHSLPRELLLPFSLSFLPDGLKAMSISVIYWLPYLKVFCIKEHTSLQNYNTTRFINMADHNTTWRAHVSTEHARVMYTEIWQYPSFFQFFNRNNSALPFMPLTSLHGFKKFRINWNRNFLRKHVLNLQPTDTVIVTRIHQNCQGEFWCNSHTETEYSLRVDFMFITFFWRQ